MTKWISCCLCAVAWAVVLDQLAIVADAADPFVGPDPQRLAAVRQKAVNFLKSSQADEGTWTSQDSVGITALCAYGLLSAGVPADDPAVVKALDRIASYVQPDGRISAPGGRIPGYETAVALMALDAGNTSGRYAEPIERAEKFLRGLQLDEGEDLEKSNINYGGAGYGPGGGRSDLSNTAFLLEALQAAGAKSDDPAVQKAILFVSRCQNLESEHNTSPQAAKINDGGFYYTPAAGGSSAAGETDEGGLRSYGSMTYAGLKSLIYAGLKPDDPRVKAALEWITKNYTVEENPGLGEHGLFYYYSLFAKCLATLDRDTIQDAQGEEHDWRKELAEHLFSLQKENGSWVNTSRRWLESDPNLVTAYSLIALKYCEPPSSADGRGD
jgi:squalene-hopene/tetraprenyl-beta-curcumene cyclase